MTSKFQNAGSLFQAVIPLDSVVSGVVSEGGGIASGKNRDPRFSCGTIELQLPFFKEGGLDLSGCFLGTLNVDVSPKVFKIIRSLYTFREVAWHSEFTEHFSFCNCAVEFCGKKTFGFLYYPHVETKIAHFDKPSHLQILAPRLLISNTVQPLWCITQKTNSFCYNTVRDMRVIRLNT